jgi:hypothetical protein
MKKKTAAALFVSFKTSRAIPGILPYRRDFMIQATLDAGVRRIDYHPVVALDDRVIRTETVAVERDDGRYVIDFVDARPLDDPQAEGLLQLGFELGCSGILAVTAADMAREPILSAAREVWHYSGVTLHAGDRAQVLEALDEEGPVPLRALQGLVCTRRDPVHVVYALACEGSVAIDLQAGLDGRTIVRGATFGLSRRCAT